MDRVREITNQAGGNAEPARELEIPQLKAKIEGAITSLNEAAAELINRLVPVLREVPASTGGKPTPPTNSTDMSRWLENRLGEIKAVRLDIVDALDRLEL